VASPRRLGVPLLLALVLLVTAAASPIYAAPGAPAKPSVSDIERQIDDANNKLEPMIEDFNKVHSQLGTDQKQVADLTRKLQPLQTEVNFALAKIQPLVTQLYENGNVSTLDLLTAHGLGTLLDRLTVGDQVAHIQHKKIENVLVALNKYLTAKKSLDTAVTSLQLRKADLANRTKVIQAQLDALQKLRRQVFGTSASVGTLRPVVCPYTYIGGAAGIAVKTACAQIGKPYVWAAAGPNTFDCSGLTLYAWGKAGKTLRHYTQWQWADARPVTRAQLQPGDLVFFYPGSLHHMGIYVGGGWMVHAPHTGDVVRMARIDTYPIAGYRRP
jgi:peptidoglycan DL-endopeptidase CwlO